MLPEELLHHLNRRSCSLLIKGTAGSGKTILALTLLKVLATDVNFLYLSTRASPAQLFRDYPWLAETFPSGPGATGSAVRVHPGFVDARLDEPGPLFERITSELMDVRTPMIVIDTWNPMEDYVSFEDLQVNVKVLQSWIERVGGKLILVGEEPNDSTLDALVDGIVVLKQSELDARRVRELTLVKLRGTGIQTPVYNFTLKDGLFKTFPHSRVEDLLEAPVRSRRSNLIPETQRGGHISTGYPELDQIYGGGFARGTLVEVEMGTGLDPKMAMLFLMPLLGTFLGYGGRAEIVPWQGASKGFMTKLLANLPPNARRRVDILEGDSKGLAPARQSPGPEEEISLSFAASDQVRPWPNGRRGDEAERSLMVVVRPHGRAPTSALNAEVRLKLLYLGGTLFVEPEVPYSQLHAIVKRGSGKSARICLEQVS
jgi:KaiC/GvpD/RAD55 family RecA-like ATPase